jgi:hypothetical protein
MLKYKNTLIGLVSIFSLGLIPFQIEARDIEDAKTDMQKLLPDITGFKGWKQSEELRYYKAEPSDPSALDPILNDPRATVIPSLWEYIDGAADNYYTYGFIILQLNRYQYENNPNVEITVEIYLMKNPLNAFGIYSAEKRGVEQFLDISIEGYYVKDSLIFWHGPYYIKLSSYGINEDDGKTLNRIASEISGKINDTTPSPDAVKFFPKLPGAKNNAVYVPSEMLGIGIIGDGFVTEVTFNETFYKLFIKILPSEKQASELFNGITNYLSRNGKIETPPDGWDKNTIRIFRDSRIGNAILLQKGSVIAGITEFENTADALKIARMF